MVAFRLAQSDSGNPARAISTICRRRDRQGSRGCGRRNVPNMQHLVRQNELKVVHQRSIRTHRLRADSGTVRDQVSADDFVHQPL